MDISPTEIKRRDDSLLEITWSNGEHTPVSSATLRNNCPCAECRMKRGDDSHATPLTPKKSLLKIVEHTKEESLRLVSVWAVGQYAIGIKWGDGHDSGIFSYPYLHELATR